MQHYVISLAADSDRRQHIGDEFARQGLAFSFFDALNGEAGLSLAQRLGIRVRTDVLSAGEIGCLMSHIAVWQQALADEQEYIAVFEDDVYLSHQAAQVLDDAVWRPHPDIGFVKLETMHVPCLLDRRAVEPVAGLRVQRLWGNHWGSAGYIARRDMVQNCFDFVRQHEINKPVDDLLFAEMLAQMRWGFYQMNPAVCIQDKTLMEQERFTSLLDTQRRALRLRLKAEQQQQRRSLGDKARREWQRLCRQLAIRNLYFKYRQARSVSTVVPYQTS